MIEEQVKLESTGKRDRNNNEIFVSDLCIRWWGYFTYKGEIKHIYKIHSIKKVYESNGGFRYNTGDSYNRWLGHHVEKISVEYFKKMEIPEETSFFFDENSTPTLLTFQLRFGLTDEQWQTEVERRNEIERKFWFR